MKLKKLLVLLVSVISLASLPQAFAGSGKATASAMWLFRSSDGSSWNAGMMFITNITNHTLNVQVTYYNMNGGMYPASYYTIINMINNNTQIAPHSTVKFFVTPTVATQDFGIATIEWQNQPGDNDTVGLIAHAHNVAHYGGTPVESNFSVEVNHGDPF